MRRAQTISRAVFLGRETGYTVIDVGNTLKETQISLAVAVGLALATLVPTPLYPQTGAATDGPPPSTGGFFPLSEVRRGMTATAWTVFTGIKPEPMEVEILGVLRGARGPGQDMILAQLHGAKPEYTGVVAGMSGSPVYIGNKLLGSLSYRIGQFSKDPIAGITPIAQMLEVRDIPVEPARRVSSESAAASAINSTSFPRPGPENAVFQAMETPLTMSGFQTDAVKLWQQRMAGTGLDMVAAGGGSSEQLGKFSPDALSTVMPGSAVSALLVRGDLEIAATCTVTYIDLTQLLACGHPLLQAGPVSLPMTTADVVATLASPLNAFKIVNTGATIGAFTQDRDAAIRGVLRAQAAMIPVQIAVHGSAGPRQLHIEVLDLPLLTPQAVLVSLYQALLQTNESAADTSYHVTGNIQINGYPASRINLWASGGDGLPSPLMAALETGEQFGKLYSNGARRGSIRSIDLDVEEIPRRVSVELVGARLVSGNIVHAGDTVTVEASIRPWQQEQRNVRIPIKLPDRLQPGTLRMLISDAATLDRTLQQPQAAPRPPDMNAAIAEASGRHAADRIYVSLLVPETQAGLDGLTLTALPISLANALEPRRSGQGVNLNGESAVLEADIPAEGVLSGFQVLNVHIESGGGVN